MKVPRQAAHGGRLGERIRRLRRGEGMSQVELGRRVGVKAVQISSYERGIYAPRIAVLGRIAEALETTTDYLLAGTGGGRLKALLPLLDGLPAEQRANLVEFLEALLRAHSLRQPEQQAETTTQA